MTFCIEGAPVTEKMSETFTMKPIGTMRTVFHFKNGTPRQSALCEAARGILTIDKSVFNNPEHSLEGLQQFSHAWIIFVFHKNNNVHTKAKVRPPRLDGRRVGVFSTRSPYRPNNIGLSLVKIDRVQGSTIHFCGIDLLDGTPILDIKPYIPDYDKPKNSLSFVCSGDQMEEVFRSDCVVNLTEDYRADDYRTDDYRTDDYRTEDYRTDDYRTDDSRHDFSKVQERTSNDRDSLVHENIGTDTVGNDNDRKVHENFGTETVGNDSDSKVHENFGTETVGNNYYLDLNVKDDFVQQIVTDSNIQHVTASNKNESTITEYHVTSKQNNSTIASEQTCLCSGEVIDTTSTETIPSVVAPWLLSPPVVKLTITFTQEALEQLTQFSQQASDPHYRLDLFKDADEARRSIAEIIQEDPRSVYRRQHCQDNLYYLAVDVLHVTCWFDEDKAQVVRVKPVALVPKLNEIVR